jgi:hypothetical protein
MAKAVINTKLLALTPAQVYLQQVGATFEAIRYSNTDLSYIPAQFGGLTGQNLVSNSGVVLEVISFDIES